MIDTLASTFVHRRTSRSSAHVSPPSQDPDSEFVNSPVMYDKWTTENVTLVQCIRQLSLDPGAGTFLFERRDRRNRNLQAAHDNRGHHHDL